MLAKQDVLGFRVAMSSTAETRHRAILSLVRSQGFVSSDALAAQLEVSVQTIRRDLDQLQEDRQLVRRHGGAGLDSSIENVSYADRKVLYGAEKVAIAELVARHIPPRSSVFINIGTTTEAVARALAGHDGLRVITNNLHVAFSLSRTTDFEVNIAGGRVRNRDGGVIGPLTTEAIDTYRFDYGIIGISGIDEDGALLDFDPDEIRAARAILRNARSVFLVADHSKFTRRPMLRMGSIKEVTALFTDREPPKAIQAILSEHGVMLYLPAPPQKARKRA